MLLGLNHTGCLWVNRMMVATQETKPCVLTTKSSAAPGEGLDHTESPRWGFLCVSLRVGGFIESTRSNEQRNLPFARPIPF
jgi:hypothetical protein